MEFESEGYRREFKAQEDKKEAENKRRLWKYFWHRKKRRSKTPLTLSKRSFSHVLTISVARNNIFCNLMNYHQKRTVMTGNAGKYKIKLSKSKLFYNFHDVLNPFITNVLKKKRFIRGLIIKITSPIRIRKKIIKNVCLKFKKMPLLLQVMRKKIFNGCLPHKRVRKKRRRFTIFK